MGMFARFILTAVFYMAQATAFVTWTMHYLPDGWPRTWWGFLLLATSVLVFQFVAWALASIVSQCFKLDEGN
jgi:hypothetical protein